MNELDQFIDHIEKNMMQNAIHHGDQFVVHALKFAKELRILRQINSRGADVQDVEAKEVH